MVRYGTLWFTMVHYGQGRATWRRHLLFSLYHQPPHHIASRRLVFTICPTRVLTHPDAHIDATHGYEWRDWTNNQCSPNPFYPLLPSQSPEPFTLNFIYTYTHLIEVFLQIVANNILLHFQFGHFASCSRYM